MHGSLNQNRMDEAKMLWESISNSKWFAQTPMILFLNKVSLENLAIF